MNDLHHAKSNRPVESEQERAKRREKALVLLKEEIERRRVVYHAAIISIAGGDIKENKAAKVEGDLQNAKREYEEAKTQYAELIISQELAQD